MGKKFTNALVDVAAIVAAYWTSGSSLAWVRALSTALYAYGISGLANLTIGALFGPRRGSPPPINATVRGTVEYRRLVFGTVRTGGVLVHYGNAGDTGEILWYVIAYAGHQCSAFHDFWLDERLILESDIPSGDGGVITADPWKSKLAIYKHLGGSGQLADDNLVAAFSSPTWDDDHRLQGITYAAIEMTRDDEVYQDGPPQSVSTKLDGLLTYDARKDSTNGGSGSHRYTDPRTWEFSRDPVQHIRWELTGGSVHNDDATPLVRYGCGELNSRIEDSYSIASSNICDEVLTGSVQPPSGDQPRYRCDLEANCGETRREILETLLASMAGRLVYVRGKWRILAGAYDAPVHALTQDDIYDSELKVDDTVGHDKRYNAVSPIFIDAGQQYIQTTGKLRTDSEYEVQDNNERIPVTLQLDAVTDQYQAQRLAETHKRKSRMMRSTTIPGALNLLPVALCENLTFSHARYGWTNRVFKCMQRSIRLADGAGRVDLICERDDAGVWTDLLTADYTAGTSSTDTYQGESPSPPTELRSSSQDNGILLSWRLSPTPGVTYELEESTSDSMSSPTVVYSGADAQALISKADTTTYYYRVVARRTGLYSTYEPPANGVAGVTATVTAGFRASVSPGSVYQTTQNSSVTTVTTAVASPINGTAPFTYAWSRISGDSSISIVSPTSSSTKFSRSGLVSETRYSALFRVTITDNTSATATADVAVTIDRGPVH